MTTFVERYASVAGSGSHDGTSAANAWTIAEATANVVAGNRVNCLAGTYIADDSSSSAVMDLDVIGTVGSWIEWRAYTTTIGDFIPGDTQPVVLDAGTNSLSHAVLASTIAAAAYNRFIGFELTNGSGHGFNGISIADTFGFIGCKFSDNGGRGLQGDNSYTFLLCEFTGNTTNALDVDNNLTMTACIVHDENISTAVVTTGNSNGFIDCLFYDNAAGIVIRAPASAGIYVGNTFDGDGQVGAIAILFTGTSTIPATLVNNIFYDLDTAINFGTGGVEESRVRGFNYFSSCNINYDGIVDETTDIDDGTTDPFEDSAARDYTLASGSNAIGAGVDVGNFV